MVYLAGINSNRNRFHEADKTQIESFLADIQPSRGWLVPLRTLAEVQSSPQLEDAYIVRVSVKVANNLSIVIGQTLPPDTLAHLQHVRRFVTADYLSPSILQRLQIAERENRVDIENSDTPDLLATSIQGREEPSIAVSPSRSSPSPLFLLAAPTSAIPSTSLQNLLAPLLDQPPHQVRLAVLPIPSSPPSDAAAAAELSSKYWPVVYKSHNPHGPQPAELRHSEAEIRARAGKWISLARRLGREVKESGMGEAIGAVIVDSKADEGRGAIVAGAGDGRWVSCCHPREGKEKDESETLLLSSAERQTSPNGNPLAHAAIRAIGMVGQQRVALDPGRRRTKKDEGVGEDNTGLDFDTKNEKQKNKPLANSAPESTPTTTAPNSSINSPFLDVPLTATESLLDSSSPLQASGYLCLGLDIYLSHEPCVMCSMAIMHSRFSRVVFARRARKAGVGGMCAEDVGAGGDAEEERSGEGEGDGGGDVEEEGQGARGYGYGLFWRPQLNWRILAWEWVDDEEGNGGGNGDEVAGWRHA